MFGQAVRREGFFTVQADLVLVLLTLNILADPPYKLNSAENPVDLLSECLGTERCRRLANPLGDIQVLSVKGSTVEKDGKHLGSLAEILQPRGLLSNTKLLKYTPFFLESSHITPDSFVVRQALSYEGQQ